MVREVSVLTAVTSASLSIEIHLCGRRVSVGLVGGCSCFPGSAVCDSSRSRTTLKSAGNDAKIPRSTRSKADCDRRLCLGERGEVAQKSDDDVCVCEGNRRIFFFFMRKVDTVLGFFGRLRR